MAELLTADDPRVVRLRAAVDELNSSENALIEELPAADAAHAGALARRVGAARAEFAAAFDVVDALVEGP